MGFKGAFKCEKYQGEKGKPCDCPAWLEMVQRDVLSGAERIRKDCSYVIMPELMVEVIKSSNRPAEEISAMRGEFVKGFQKVNDTFLRLIPALPRPDDATPNKPGGG